jgi:hypothetical protein
MLAFFGLRVYPVTSPRQSTSQLLIQAVVAGIAFGGLLHLFESGSWLDFVLAGAVFGLLQLSCGVARNQRISAGDS